MLDRQNSIPLHVQLEEIIKNKIDNQEWKESDKIPSENELSSMYGLSRMTVRSVITRLVIQGLLYRVSGKGTFVAKPKIMSRPLSQMGIREQLDQMGIESTTKLIQVQRIPASPRIQKELMLRDASEVYFVERVRYIKDEPLSIHISYIPVHFAPDLENRKLEEEQLCVILEKTYKMQTSRIVETLETSLATATQAELLSVKPGFTLLRLENTVYSPEGHPFEHTRVVFRGDKIKLKLEYFKDNY